MNGATITAPIVHHTAASGRYPLILPRNVGHSVMLWTLVSFTDQLKGMMPKF
jgi:hypothetical protein